MTIVLRQQGDHWSSVRRTPPSNPGKEPLPLLVSGTDVTAKYMEKPATADSYYSSQPDYF